MRITAIILLGLLAVPVRAERPIEAGDLILAHQRNVPQVTMSQLRPQPPDGICQPLPLWPSVTLPRTPRFDNAGGAFRATNNNLLVLSIGSPVSNPVRDGEGGVIYLLSTNGTNVNEVLYRFNTRWVSPPVRGIENTRVTGLSISPTGTEMACVGYDTGSLYMMQYTPGPTPGTGHGAHVQFVEAFGGVAPTLSQVGSVWSNPNMLYVFIGGPASAPGLPYIQPLYRDSINFAVQDPVALPIDPPPAGVRSTAVEHVPSICPFIICLYSGDLNGEILNYLWFVEPQTYRIVRLITMHESINAGNELSIGPDRRLYISHAASIAAPYSGYHVARLTLDLDQDGDIDESDILNLANDSAVRCYDRGTDVGVRHTGVQVPFPPADAVLGACCISGTGCAALTATACAAYGGTYLGDGAGCVPGACAGCGGALRGDSNCDGAVDNGDIDCFVAALLESSGAQWAACVAAVNPACGYDFACANDVNGDGAVDNGDIDAFVACLISLPDPGVACP